MCFNFSSNIVVRRLVFGVMVLLLLAGCGAEVAEPTATPEEIVVATDAPEPTAEPTETAVPTDTPTPTAAPTETSAPTNTPVPSNTPEPTSTPSRPTHTPERPTLTPTADKAEETTEEEAASEVVEDEPETPVNAFDVFAKSNAAVEKAETLILKQTVQVTAGGTFTQTMMQDCSVDQAGDPPSSYCETIASVAFMGEDPVEDRNEIVVIGEEMWIKTGDAEEWESLPADFMQQSGFSEDFGQLRLSEFVTTAEISGETVIDGEAVYEITFELDVATYFANILGEETANMFAELSEEMSGGGKLWIGQTDYYPHKADIEMVFLIEGEEMITTTQAGYVYNQPVRIPDPTE